MLSLKEMVGGFDADQCQKNLQRFYRKTNINDMKPLGVLWYCDTNAGP